MKKKILDFCMNLIENSKPSISKKEKDKIRYGLEGLYLTITKMIVITIVAYILGILKEYLILLITFNGIRLFGFGVHAKKSSHCLFSSMLFFILFPILCKELYISTLYKKILAIPLIMLVLILSPADTEKRPLKNKNKRLLYKFLSTTIAFIYMFLSINIKNNMISNCFMFALVIQIIIMLPITYKLFGVSYNNYKKFEVNF